jgi:hypothetical protein
MEPSFRKRSKDSNIEGLQFVGCVWGKAKQVNVVLHRQVDHFELNVRAVSIVYQQDRLSGGVTRCYRG